MENSRNKQFISFKLYTILSSTMESLAVPFCPTQEVNHPFVQRILPISHLVAILVVSLIAMVSQCF